MKVVFKISECLFRSVMEDLRRPHAFALERVGFLLCRPGDLPGGGVAIFAGAFHSVADEDYLDDQSAGAVMGPAAIRKALQVSYNKNASMLHVHIHEHQGKPRFSGIDKRETSLFVPDFWHVQPALPHGAVVFSKDSAFGQCWIPGMAMPQEITDFISVGAPIRRL
jgi:hypothetical protein